jgi:hypothetical protein
MFLEQYDLFGLFSKTFIKVTGVRLFFGYLKKNKYSRVVLFIFVNFDVFTNKTVE